MKTILGIAFLIAPIMIGAQEGSQLQLVDETLTLPASLERAYVNNPRILTAQQELEIAKADLGQARSLFFPSVNFQASYIRHRNETLGTTDPDLGFTVLEAPITGPSGNRANPLADNLYLGRFGLKQTLWAGGRLRSAYKLTKVKLKRAESSFSSLKREIEYETKAGFYSLLASRSKVNLVQTGLSELKQLGKQATGSHSKLSLAFAKSDLRKKLTHAQKDEKDAKFKYLQAMGLELFTDVNIDGTLETKPLAIDLQQVLAWAKQNRPELKQTQIEAEVDQLSVHLAMAERYPTFLLGGAYEFRNRKFPLNENNWNAVLSMNIPIFGGFASISRIKGSRHRAKQGRYKRVQLEDAIESEVRTTFEEVAYWQNELKIRQQELGFIQNQRKRYSPKGGAAQFGQKLDYTQWHLEARLSVIEAQHQLVLFQSQLEKAVGRSLENYD